MAGPKVFKKQAAGTLIELNIKGRFQGYDASDNPIYTPLVLRSLGSPGDTTTPPAPNASGSMLTRTSAQIDWTAPDMTGLPPLTGWNVYRDGVQVGSTLAVGTLTLTETGLPTSTSPERTFVYTVRGVNADGAGDSSNAVTLQWLGVIVQVPSAPTGFSRGAPAMTSVQLSWLETADATVDKHGLYEGNVLVRDNIDSAALTYTYAGLTPGSVHSSVNIRRHNSGGWSPASNNLTFTTPSVPPVTQDATIGTSINGRWPSFYNDWKAARVYKISDVISTFTANPTLQIMAVTDDQGVSRSSGAAGAAQVLGMLNNFYYGGTGNTPIASRAQVEIHWANGNEVDREYQTGTLPANVIDTWRLMYNAVHTELSPGVRRFPRASMGVDLTIGNVKTAGSGPRFKAIAQYCDFMAASFYPPGRQPFPKIFSRYTDFVDPLIDVATDWNATYPTMTMVACWEIGMPIDHSNPDGSPNNGGTTNWSIRPRFMAGGRASGPTGVTTIQPMGSNYEGFLNYLYRLCVERNLILKEILYWNEQSNPDIPNPFENDEIPSSPNPTSGPDLVTAWHDWTPGSRLPDL